jgi:mRNA interferase MazF
VVVLDFPGVTGVKRRPAVVLSSDTYHAARPDVIVALVTSQTTAVGVTDYVLQDWAAAGLRLPSVFRSFLATIPRTSAVSQIGRVTDRDWAAILSRVRTALTPLDPPSP